MRRLKQNALAMLTFLQFLVGTLFFFFPIVLAQNVTNTFVDDADSALTYSGPCTAGNSDADW